MKIKKRYKFGIPVLALAALIGLNIHTGIPVEELYPEYKTPGSQILQVEGMPLHYRVTGSGPDLLLLHGVASSLHTWEGWQEELSDQFRVISFDLPSFGLTGPNPQNDYSVAMYMRTIDALLDHLGVDSTCMAGNSFGGFLTWNYALHRPRRLRKIILLDAGGLRSPGEGPHDFGMRLIASPWTRAITHVITPKFLVKRSVYNAYFDDSKITPGIVDSYYDMLLRKGNREGFSEVMGGTITENQNPADLVKQVKLPTLILWGEEDRIIPVEKADQFHALIENSELIIYPKVGHIPMEEIPQQSAEDARRFLSK